MLCESKRSDKSRYLDIVIEAVRAVEPEAGVAVLHEAPGLGLGGAGGHGGGAPGRAVAGGGGLRQPRPGLLLPRDEAIDSLGDGGLLGPGLGLLLLVLVLNLKMRRVMSLIFLPSGFNGNEWKLEKLTLKCSKGRKCEEFSDSFVHRNNE